MTLVWKVPRKSKIIKWICNQTKIDKKKLTLIKSICKVKEII